MKHFGGNLTQIWINSIRDMQLRNKFESFIIKYISPPLIADILNSATNTDSVADSDFSVKLNKNNNEVKCIYEIDDQNLEIGIDLPANYPLSQISVKGLCRIGVDEKKWKSWILACRYVINLQNGTILEAIKHFKSNVQLNFQDYDDCAICYSILNAVDHSTPNKVCTTCKHNFHSACLYRWFKSSGSSTCPLCRAKFQFKKHS
ncbi:unnamed protein product [Ambrosiozyma monospora]|uniref:E3 ubiquitin-protein ligase listerin n=1 Tax=Ambrosiozyma monospora TaxID=43982 RepID=A0A9W6Z119_AMBMO|nr:unnamed protein product [Ambrosiozyma monospora]